MHISPGCYQKEYSRVHITTHRRQAAPPEAPPVLLYGQLHLHICAGGSDRQHFTAPCLTIDGAATWLATPDADGIGRTPVDPPDRALVPA